MSSNTRLEIGSNENVGYFTELPVHIIFQISDIRQPDKAKGTRSFTIKIPTSPDNNILFENIFEVNTSLQTFNPHLKTAAKYYIDELIQFDGYAQLLSINWDETKKQGEYEISLIGEILTIFTDISNLYLTDLNFSEYDHLLDYTHIVNSWSNLCKVNNVYTALANGEGYVYPMIDWGTNNSNLSTMTPTDFRGALFVREYLYKIFTDAGYTWDSSFLDSSFFKKLIIPAPKKPTLSQSAIDNNKFLAIANGSESHTMTITSGGSLINFTYPSTLNNVNFQTETYDTGNIFVTPSFTVPTTTVYNLTCALAMGFVIKRNGVDVTANIQSFTNTGIHIKIYNVTTATVAGLFDLDTFSPTLGAMNNATYNAGVQLNNIALIAGDVYKVVITYASATFVYPSSSASATWDLIANIKVNSFFSAELVSPSVYEGSTVEANTLIPVGMKQTDFIANLIRMFNLRFMVDPSDSSKYIIEPREDFYYNVARDWTQKHDDNSITQIIPLGELDAKTYRNTYKADGDYYNKTHSDYYKNFDGSPKVYGTYEIDITNDFLKNIAVTELLFAPTPYASYTGIVAPAIIKKENNTISGIDSQPRILYWSGSLSNVGVNWNFVYNNGANTVNYTSYPHAGHTDNPFAPTLDLNFGLPVKVYYTYPNLYWTTNNLWNKYHYTDFQRRTDKNSKIVITDFFLTPNDIHIFDFRYPIFWKDAYYLVNKLDYNPIETQVTRVELLKLTHFDAYVPFTYNLPDNGDPNQTWQSVSNQNITIGDNNFNNGNSSFIFGGNNNFIANSSTSVMFIGCENCSAIGVENFTAINASGKSFDSSYSNTIYNGSDDVVNISSDTSVDRSYHNKTLMVDASGGDVTLTFDIANLNNANIDIIRVDSSSNIILIDATSVYGTENFIGNSFPYNLTLVQYDALPLKIVSDTIYVAK